MIIRLISTSATPKDLKGDKLRKLNSDKKTAAKLLPVSGRGMMTDKQRKKLQSKSASLKENFESALGEELFEAQGTPQAAPIFKRFMGFSPVSGSQVGIGSSDVYRTDQGGWVFLITPNKDRMVLLVQPGTPSLDKQLFTKRRPNEFLVYADRNLEGGPSDGYINPVPGTIVTFVSEDSAKSYFKHLMKADLADIESQFRQVNTDPAVQKYLKAWDSNL